MNKAFVTVALAFSAAPARADSVYGMSENAKWLAATQQRVPRDVTMPRPTCEASLAEARKEGRASFADAAFKDFGGVAQQDSMKRTVFAITFAQAEDICRRVALYQATLVDAKVFYEIAHGLDFIAKQLVTPAFAEHVIALAPDCHKAADALLAAKLPPTLPFVIVEQDVAYTQTVADLKPKLCDAAKHAAAQLIDAARAKLAQARARFTKHGIADDKLELMMQYGGSLFLAGGAAPADLRRYAAASTLFVWLTSAPDRHDDVIHTVRRYRFKGNRLVGESEKLYRRKRSAQLGASVFK